MSHVIIPGDIRAEIGADGVAEALRQRWLVPDTDSGYLCAANDLATVAEMQRLAEMPSEEFKSQDLPVAESHDLALLHTKRQHSINEIAAPMTGAPSPGLAAVAEPQPPQAPQAPQAAGTGGKDPQVGTNVMVARQGVKATGVIEKLLPDGRFQVGYGQDVKQKPPGDNIFSKNEVTLVPGAQQSPASTAPAAA